MLVQLPAFGVDVNKLMRSLLFDSALNEWANCLIASRVWADGAKLVMG